VDAPTVITILAAHLICSGGLLLLVERRMAEGQGMRMWAYGLALYGAAFAVRLAAGLADPAPWGAIADLATFAALLLLGRGLQQFFGAAGPARPMWLLVGAYAVAHGAVLAAFGTLPRFVEHNAVIGLVMLWLAWLAGSRLRHLPAQDPARRPLLALAGLAGTLGVLSLLRVVAIAQGGVATIYRGWVAQAYFGVASIMALVVALLLLWMVFLRLNRQLAELATRDALTRVLNRNGLDEALVRHFATRPEPLPLTLLVVDIDHFKSVNDRHGHAVGDAMLRAVAGALTEQLRGNDFVARVGGEEFLVGCAIPEGEPARLLGERLRREVAGLVVPADGAGASARCTVSIGISPPFTRHADYEGALRAADRALYAAKAAGRDRVEMAGAG
jgi:diguanylate cyclase (GGDEF)-like protein